MPITFRCERCHKEVKAPDSAAGQRGKCPFCGEGNYIPDPAAANDDIPLAEIDEAEELRRLEHIRQLKKQEAELLSETGGGPDVPLEHKEDLTPEDLYHFVVNYCLDMVNGRLDRTAQHVANLKKYKYTGLQAVEDFITGKALEPVLEPIPRGVLKGFLQKLAEDLKA